LGAQYGENNEGAKYCLPNAGLKEYEGGFHPKALTKGTHRDKYGSRASVNDNRPNQTRRKVEILNFKCLLFIALCRAAASPVISPTMSPVDAAIVVFQLGLRSRRANDKQRKHLIVSKTFIRSQEKKGRRQTELVVPRAQHPNKRICKFAATKQNHQKRRTSARDRFCRCHRVGLRTEKTMGRGYVERGRKVRKARPSHTRKRMP